MKTETTADTTVITAHTTVLGAMRAYLADGVTHTYLIGRDGSDQLVESFSRGQDTVAIYIATGPDTSEDGDGTPFTEIYTVSRDRKVVVRVVVYDRGDGHQADVDRVQTILQAKHVAGQSYPGQ